MNRIVKTHGICGGSARIEGTRIAVWILASWWRQGAVDEDILSAYPGLTQQDLDDARLYIRENYKEIHYELKVNG